MKLIGWFVKITTDVGTIVFPFDSQVGYYTKNEAEFVAAEAMRNTPGIISAEVFEIKK